MLSLALATGTPGQALAEEGKFVPPAVSQSPSAEATVACYPIESRILDEQARVSAVIEVNTDGSARVLELPEGTSERLRKAVNCVLELMRFQPATRDGLAVISKARLPFVFSLKEKPHEPRLEDDLALRLVRLDLGSQQFETLLLVLSRNANLSEVALRVMREDPTWWSTIIEQAASRYRKEFSPDELAEIAAFHDSELGKRWQRSRATALQAAVAGDARRHLLLSACVALTLSQQVEALRQIGVPGAEALSDDTLVDIIKAGGLGAPRGSCECVLMVWEQRGGTQAFFSPQTNEEAWDLLREILDESICAQTPLES